MTSPLAGVELWPAPDGSKPYYVLARELSESYRQIINYVAWLDADDPKMPSQDAAWLYVHSNEDLSRRIYRVWLNEQVRRRGGTPMFDHLGDEKERNMSEFKQYRRKQIAELRPYVEGERLAPLVSVSSADREAGSPKAGDMIARNPKNHDDQWLVAAAYFADNFEPV